MSLFKLETYPPGWNEVKLSQPTCWWGQLSSVPSNFKYDTATRTVSAGQQLLALSAAQNVLNRERERLCEGCLCDCLTIQMREGRWGDGVRGYCCFSGTVPSETALSSPWNNRRHDSHTVPLQLVNCAQHFCGVAAPRPRVPCSSSLRRC